MNTQKMRSVPRYTPLPLNCHSGHCQGKHSRRPPWAPGSRGTWPEEKRAWGRRALRRRQTAGRRRWKGNTAQGKGSGWGGNAGCFLAGGWFQKGWERISSRHHLGERERIPEVARRKKTVLHLWQIFAYSQMPRLVQPNKPFLLYQSPSRTCCCAFEWRF